MRPMLMFVENGESKRADLYRDASGMPMVPRVGEFVILFDGQSFVVTDVVWNLMTEEVLVFGEFMRRI